MGVLFVGIVNSGLMSAWIFIFLDQEPEWRDKVLHELHVLLDKHAPVSQGFSSPSERFSRIPPQVWENEMPVLEVCVIDSCREVVYVMPDLLGLFARDYSVSHLHLLCHSRRLPN